MPKKAKVSTKRKDHAKSRAKGRYGLNLTSKDLNEIIAVIQSNSGTFVANLTNDKTLHRLEYRGQLLNVVYSKRHKAICTFLPPQVRELKSPGD